VHTLGPVTDEPDVSFSVRVGARLPDRHLHEGVPDWLIDPLLDWLKDNLRAWSARQLSIRHRISIVDADHPEHAVRVALGQRAWESENGRWELLDAIDYLCQSDLDADLAIPMDWIGNTPIPGSEPLAILNRLLSAGGSAYCYREGRLERRVADATVAAFERVAATPNDEASLHLRRAWQATYGRDPEPSRAYSEAVRAVEAVACPMFLPKDPKPTLGKVIARLRERPGDWYLVLAGEQEAAGVVPLRIMIQLLWTAQKSRHAGGPDTRDQLLTEAEAALSLAIACVQWFASGFVKRC
jgi:hypothetical protein